MNTLRKNLKQKGKSHKINRLPLPNNKHSKKGRSVKKIKNLDNIYNHAPVYNDYPAISAR
jgi:hypothetical protein